MQYGVTVMAGESVHRHLEHQEVGDVQMALLLLGAPQEEQVEHLSILLREGRTVYDNGHSMGLRVEEEPDGAE